MIRMCAVDCGMQCRSSFTDSLLTQVIPLKSILVSIAGQHTYTATGVAANAYAAVVAAAAAERAGTRAWKRPTAGSRSAPRAPPPPPQRASSPDNARRCVLDRWLSIFG